jgi:drug/metabolite transporter (DMT)-like permease
VTVLLALVGSAVFGSADFIGGASSRHAPPLWVATLGQSVALILAVPIALLANWEGVTATDATWSLVGGAVAAVGLGLFYTAMARGLISVVVPLTAVIGAAIPVAYGLGRGERPGKVALAGIVLALVAVAVVSSIPGDGQPVAAASIAFSLGAGACFGTGLVLFSRVSERAGLWPVALSRSTASLVLLGIAIALTGRPPNPISTPKLLPAGIAIGALEAGGNAALFLALERGPVAIASVLISLYPVTTVMLATVILGERLSRVQLAGVALALSSVVLISTG